MMQHIARRKGSFDFDGKYPPSSYPALKCKEVIFYRLSAASKARGAIMLRDPPGPAAHCYKIAENV